MHSRTRFRELSNDSRPKSNMHVSTSTEHSDKIKHTAAKQHDSNAIRIKHSRITHNSVAIISVNLAC